MKKLPSEAELLELLELAKDAYHKARKMDEFAAEILEKASKSEESSKIAVTENPIENLNA